MSFAKLAGARFVPVAAERIEGLHPAITQLVGGEPAYRAWVPAEICVIEAGRVVSGARAASEGSHPVVLGYSAMAVTPAGTGDIVMHGRLFSSSGTLRRLASDELIHLDGVRYSRGPVPDGTDERRVVGHDGATLTWAIDCATPVGTDGSRGRAGPARSSTSVPHPRHAGQRPTQLGLDAPQSPQT